MAVSLGLVHRLGERVALITEVQVARLAGEPVRAGPAETGVETDISFLRWAIGAETSLTPMSSRWQVRARAAIGFSTVGTDPVFDPTRPNAFAKINDDVFTLLVGLQFSRSLGTFSPFIRLQPEVYFVGSSLGQLRSVNEGIGESGTLIGVPIQLGLRIQF